MKKHLSVVLLVFALCSISWGAEFLPLPSGTRPLYIYDPVLPSTPGEPVGFACFEGCGASCQCVGREDSTTTTCYQGQKCTWPVTRCRTHSFCRWHDGCYLACDFNFPGKVDDGSSSRSGCYRACDFACIDGKAPEISGGWKTQAPGAPPEALGTWECLRLLAGSPSVAYDEEPIAYAGTPTCVPDKACEK